MKILSKNIKECNIFILLLVAVLIIGGSAYTSYAIFTTKVEGESSIKVGVGCNTFDVDLISMLFLVLQERTLAMPMSQSYQIT